MEKLSAEINDRVAKGIYERDQMYLERTIGRMEKSINDLSVHFREYRDEEATKEADEEKDRKSRRWSTGLMVGSLILSTLANAVMTAINAGATP